MKKMAFLRHWDSRFAWIEVPLAQYKNTRFNQPLVSPNNRISKDGLVLFLDAYSDGKYFIDALIEESHRKAQEQGTDYVPIEIRSVCNGTISSIRRLKQPSLTVKSQSNQ